MSDVAIEARGLWKKFHKGEMHDSLRDLIPAMAKRLVGNAPPRDELAEGDFWALRDINFDVKRGEALGIIGPNGAGKSTMLKTLTRILRPTKGRCRIKGRIGALIEVAAGFHLDLTGRENIYLQGAIMGMRRDEIDRQLESILDFAGVESFVDTPVKRYSSGMNARLGFSIAAHLQPDVLIIDEVLSVGDMSFQQKCVDRMNAFKRQGVAIAFVSHNMQAVSALCDRALFLKSSVRTIGPVQDVISSYLAATETGWESPPGAAIEVIATQLVDADGQPATAATPGQALRLDVTCKLNQDVSDATASFVVYRSTDGLPAYDGDFHLSELGFERLNAGQTVTVSFDFQAHLTRGQYHFEFNVLHNPTFSHLVQVKPVAHLRVDELRTHRGIADLAVRATIVPKTP
jgi:lipopolysaccharide transport system ATP-binding protein